MPIKKAAFKAMRTGRKKHTRNISVKSELKTRTKKVEELFSSGKLEQAKAALRELTSKLDRAASKGIIHKNTASRKKSRLMRRFLKLPVQQTPSE